MPRRSGTADALVPEDPAFLHAGHGAADEMEVGTADRARGQPHDRVRRLLDRGLGDVVQPDVTDAVVDDCLHALSFRGRARLIARGRLLANERNLKPENLRAAGKPFWHDSG